MYILYSQGQAWPQLMWRHHLDYYMERSPHVYGKSHMYRGGVTHIYGRSHTCIWEESHIDETDRDTWVIMMLPQLIRVTTSPSLNWSASTRSMNTSEPNQTDFWPTSEFWETNKRKRDSLYIVHVSEQHEYRVINV